MDRITIKHLRRAVDSLNDTFGYPRDAYQDQRDENGHLRANEGTFTLDCAYGGYRLCQMAQGGGERDLTPRGNARQTYTAIHAFRDGAEKMKAHIERELTK